MLALDRFFFIPVKISISDDEVAENMFAERYRHSEFLYSKNGQYKIADLNFYEKQHVEKYPLIDLLEVDCKKIRLDDEFKIHYDNRPCNISIKIIAVCIVKGHPSKRNAYLQIMSSGLSNLVWKVFITIMNLINEKNKKLNFFIDSILININCDLKLVLMIL